VAHSPNEDFAEVRSDMPVCLVCGHPVEEHFDSPPEDPHICHHWFLFSSSDKKLWTRCMCSHFGEPPVDE